MDVKHKQEIDRQDDGIYNVSLDILKLAKRIKEDKKVGG